MGKNATGVLLICFTLASVHLVEAQQALQVARIRYPHPGVATVSAARMQAFRNGLRDLGYVDRISPKESARVLN